MNLQKEWGIFIFLGLTLMTIIAIVIVKIKKNILKNKQIKEMTEERVLLLKNIDIIENELKEESLNISKLDIIQNKISRKKRKVLDILEIENLDLLMKEITLSVEEKKMEILFWQNISRDSEMKDVVFNKLSNNKYFEVLKDIEKLERELDNEQIKTEKSFFGKIFSSENKLLKNIERLKDERLKLEDELFNHSDYKKLLLELKNELNEKLNILYSEVQIELMKVIDCLKKEINKNIEQIQKG